jgi:membrane-bound lytic murein transglycosylase B
MLKRRYLALLPLCVLLAACSSKPKTTAEPQTAGGGGFLLEPQHNVMEMGAISLTTRRRSSSSIKW